MPGRVLWHSLPSPFSVIRTLKPSDDVISALTNTHPDPMSDSKKCNLSLCNHYVPKLEHVPRCVSFILITIIRTKYSLPPPLHRPDTLWWRHSPWQREFRAGSTLEESSYIPEGRQTWGETPPLPGLEQQTLRVGYSRADQRVRWI